MYVWIIPSALYMCVCVWSSMCLGFVYALYAFVHSISFTHASKRKLSSRNRSSAWDWAGRSTQLKHTHSRIIRNLYEWFKCGAVVNSLVELLLLVRYDFLLCLHKVSLPFRLEMPLSGLRPSWTPLKQHYRHRPPAGQTPTKMSFVAATTAGAELGETDA